VDIGLELTAAVYDAPSHRGTRDFAFGTGAHKFAAFHTALLQYATAAPGRVRIADTPALHRDDVEVSVHVQAHSRVLGAPDLCRTAFEYIAPPRPPGFRGAWE
jgi:hypothetical protein